ncbi:MAG: Unknown protein [uncultured Sulfurovum sp.]|uniref:Uncharacterized protein n=1 Tax=uncultured Sulfurovum sp. TaxID=269237 RepID=A0A6S6U2J9_9BACT|nr:MAG: Unknown protein [uncultured Sulfurovum sp.]
MKKRKILLSPIVIALLSLPIFADTVKEAPEEIEETSSLEVSGYLKAEVAAYTEEGASLNSDKTHSIGDLHKGEGTLKLFINSDIGEESSFHAELQAVTDTQGIDGYDSHRNYTQYDFLREAYIDTTLSDFDIRVGKQQVVWGKADGVKFLDIINPTDFREWGQNTMEESRIPLWMGVIEKDLGNNDSLQLVWVPDVGRINQIPGLHNTSTGDRNHPFISHGTDALTGQYNGFLNIGTDMGRVAGAFDGAFSTAFGAPSGNGILNGFRSLTVSGFTGDGTAQNPGVASVAGLINNFPGGDASRIGLDITAPANSQTNPNGTQMLTGTTIGSAAQGGVSATTNLVPTTTGYNYNNPTHMFEYMGDTTFATFNSFIGMDTKYVVNPLSQKLKNHNFGIKYAKGTDSGFNYTLNYYRHWENNPTINLQWADSAGNALNSVTTENSYVPGNPAEVAAGTAGSYTTRTVSLQNANGTNYTGPATLQMLQDVNRVDTLGASFDLAVDTSFAPIVIRGEFVYDKGSKAPEVDLGKLAYGDIVNAMTMADADMFKYVIGADVTLGKNLFTSLQFMDTWNLDYQDSQVQYAGNSRSYGRYTANPATLGLANQFRKAQEHQIMYTLFLSKPFLESDALRVNNLFLYEQEAGGYWNRFDLEYSYSDDTILSAEWNKYGGDKFGVFGQFEAMSNVQVGAKYIF